MQPNAALFSLANVVDLQRETSCLLHPMLGYNKRF